jgi:hypothetical protein
MAQEIKGAFKELVDRLEAACVTDQILEGVKLVEGPTEQVFTDEDLPVLIYEVLEGGFAEDSHFPNQMRAKMTVLLTMMVHESKGYYNDDKTGMIDYYEKIMSVIDGDLTTELTGSDHWGPIPPQYRVGGFERNGLQNTYLIEVELQTIRYSKGALQT